MNNAGVTKSDIKINGENFLTGTLANYSASTEAVGAIADAINLNTGVHGAVATAFNRVDSLFRFIFHDWYFYNKCSKP